jgi:purine-binding chemotaxis protein CheW
MDILAARKKAAERAKAGKTGPSEPALPAREEERQEEPAPVIPLHPEAGVVPMEAMPVPAEEPALPGEPAREAAAPAGPDAGAPAPGEVSEEPADEQQEPEREREREMLAFLLGTEEYAVPVDQVQEVLTPREITPVPHTPAYVLGVCSLRGVVLPIIDLHRRLGLPAAPGDEKSRIIVMGLGRDDRIGLFVDRVRGVVRFLPSAVRPVPENIEQGAEFLQGIVRRDDRLFILLDIEKTAEI